MMWLFLSALLAGHGLVHLFGFIEAFWRAKRSKPISRPVGVLWGVAAGLFIAAAVLVFAAPTIWWAPALAGLVCSEILIAADWHEARFGTVLNAILVVPIALGVLANAPGSFRARYEALALEHRVSAAAPVITQAQLTGLPDPVATWLRRSGVVGKAQVRSIRATLRGEIRAKVDGPWMPFTAIQEDFFTDAPARLFLIDSSMHGLPFQALHVYLDGTATMEVKLASVLKVVDARGPEMNRSETVTLFNDMFVMAPSAVLDPSVAWSPIDGHHAKATLTTSGQTVSAELTFDDAGDLVRFTSDDRLQTEDGKSYRSLRWSTPLTAHRSFGSTRLAGHGEASWAGEQPYVRMELIDVVDGQAR